MLIPVLVVVGVFVTLVLLADWGARAVERRQEARFTRSGRVNLSGERRWNDEQAWRTWQRLEAIRAEPWDTGQMVGQVSRVYQQAKRGTKALVNFGPHISCQDTWWEGKRPRSGQWVLVRAHLGWGPHSEREIWYINAVDEVWPSDLKIRAERFSE